MCQKPQDRTGTIQLKEPVPDRMECEEGEINSDLASLIFTTDSGPN